MNTITIIAKPYGEVQFSSWKEAAEWLKRNRRSISFRREMDRLVKAADLIGDEIVSIISDATH